MNTPSRMQQLGIRLVFTIILFVTLIPARSAVFIFSIIQFGCVAYFGSPQKYLLTITHFITQYITSALHYTLFISDTLPYPFNKFN